MRGVACNGWRFWSFEGDAPAPREPKAKVEKPARVKKAKNTKPAMLKQIRRVVTQKGLEPGQAKWFCSSCMDSFVTDTETQPEQCPQGHSAVVEDEFAKAD